jgi:membrane fusion protein (multidrug efflux system)
VATTTITRVARFVRRALTATAVLAAAAGAAACGGKKEAPPPPPPEVLVTDIVRKDVPVQRELVGQTRGSEDVDIRARVEGFLEDVQFTEGTFVHKGDELYRIDRKPLEAQLANEKAELATAQARLAKAQNDVNRLRPLAAKQAVSAQELDNAVAFEDAARSQVAARQAAVEKASLDLGYTAVTSPIDGIIGTTQVKAGSLVGRGESTLLTTISRVDPILFRAGLSEAEYLNIARRTEEIRAANGGKPVPIELVLADGSVHPEKGQLDVVERAVDAATGTITLQFKFPNPGGILRPGQYGRARFILESKSNAMLVPQRAVQELQNLYSVAVVGSDNKVTFKTVKMGPRMGGLWVVESGLQGNEKVIVAGMQRVRDGSVVTAKPAPPSDAGSGQVEPSAGAGE